MIAVTAVMHFRQCLVCLSSHLLADAMFVCESNAILDYMAADVSSYAWLFAHQPSWTPTLLKVLGVYHSTELEFVFSTAQQTGSNPTPAVKPTLMHKEIGLATRMSTAWTNFARYHNPNGPNGEEATTWPQWGAGQQRYQQY